MPGAQGGWAHRVAPSTCMEGRQEHGRWAPCPLQLALGQAALSCSDTWMLPVPAAASPALLLPEDSKGAPTGIALTATVATAATAASPVGSPAGSPMAGGLPAEHARYGVRFSTDLGSREPAVSGQQPLRKRGGLVGGNMPSGCPGDVLHQSQAAGRMCGANVLLRQPTRLQLLCMGQAPVRLSWFRCRT